MIHRHSLTLPRSRCSRQQPILTSSPGRIGISLLQEAEAVARSLLLPGGKSSMKSGQTSRSYASRLPSDLDTSWSPGSSSNPSCHQGKFLINELFSMFICICILWSAINFADFLDTRHSSAHPTFQTSTGSSCFPSACSGFLGGSCTCFDHLNWLCPDWVFWACWESTILS